MGRSRLLDTSRAVLARKECILALVTAVFIVVYGVRIVGARVEPVFDQRKLLDHELSEEGYPAFESGLSSSLLAGLCNGVRASDAITANARLRIVAMVLYLVSGMALFSTLAGQRSILVALLPLLLLFTSRFPFLWLSSEVFAGAFLMLLLWGVAHGLSFLILACFTALYTLAKPDLLLPGLAAGLFLAFSAAPSWRKRIFNGALLFVPVAVMVLPGVLRDGLSYFEPQGRAVFSFGQHYAAMVAKHQVVSPLPDPWLEWEDYFEPVWGQTESFIKAVLSSPARYVDYVFLSISHSLKNFFRSNLLLILPLSIYSLAKARRSTLKVAGLLLMTGFIPITLLSYTHTRYIARFYPLFLFFGGLYIAESGADRRERSIILGFLAALLVFQSWQLRSVLAAGLWFPD